MLLDCCFYRRDTTSSLHSSVQQHWLKAGQPSSLSSSVVSLALHCAKLWRRPTYLTVMNLAGHRGSRLEWFTAARHVYTITSAMTSRPVASLGLVLSGAVTDGVTLFFWRPLFSHRPLEWKVVTFLAIVSSPLPSSHVVYPVFFFKFSRKQIILFGCRSLDGVTRGGPPLP